MSQTETEGVSATQKGKEAAKDAGAHAQDKALELKDQAQEKAHEAKGQVAGRVREQVNTRSTEAGQQLGSVAEALRSTSEKLTEDGKDIPARIVEQGAEQAERLGTYLRDADADVILQSVEDFGRRRPAVVAAGAAVLGFLASRFLRASSERRYQTSPDRQSTAYRRVPSPSSVAYEDPMARPGGSPEADLHEELRPQRSSNQPF